VPTAAPDVDGVFIVPTIRTTDFVVQLPVPAVFFHNADAPSRLYNDSCVNK